MKLLITLFLGLIVTLSHAQLSISELFIPFSNPVFCPTDYTDDNKYVEFYNGNASSVDLTGWELRIVTNGAECYTHTLSGTIASDGAKVFGTDHAGGGLSGNVDFEATTANWNSAAAACYANWDGEERDGARLYKDGVLVDDAVKDATSSADYYGEGVLLRKSSGCYPTSVFTIGEWDNSSGFCDEFNAQTHICTTLPVVLKDFTAEAHERYNLISWGTLTEVDNDRFVLLKSSNGVDFTELTTIQGQGSSNILQEYSYKDYDTNEQSYYRLQQVDYNGVMEVYSSVSCRREIESEVVTVFPNPAGSTLHITGSESNWTIRSVDGRKLMEGKGSEVHLDGISPGWYFVQTNEQVIRFYKH